MTSTLRVATWNTSKGSFGRIAGFVEAEKPEVLVLTESRRLSNDQLGAIGATGAAWAGDHLDAGVGIYTFGDYGLDSAAGAWSTPRRETETERERTVRFRRWTLAAEVVGPHSFFLLGVWAHNEWAYRPVNDAIEQHADRLAGPSMVVGDFNNGSEWDEGRGNPKDHAHTVQLLGAHCLASAYHVARGISESIAVRAVDPTFWNGYDEAKPHHIDFIYARNDWIRSDPDSVRVGEWAAYAGASPRLSDHAPVTADLHPGP